MFILLNFTTEFFPNERILTIFCKTTKREGWNVQVDEECGAIMELSDLNLPFIQFQKKDFRRACFFIVKVGSGLGTKISLCPFLWIFMVFTTCLIDWSDLLEGNKLPNLTTYPSRWSRDQTTNPNHTSHQNALNFGNPQKS